MNEFVQETYFCHQAVMCAHITGFRFLSVRVLVKHMELVNLGDGCIGSALQIFVN